MRTRDRAAREIKASSLGFTRSQTAALRRVELARGVLQTPSCDTPVATPVTYDHVVVFTEARARRANVCLLEEVSHGNG